MKQLSFDDTEYSFNYLVDLEQAYTENAEQAYTENAEQVYTSTENISAH